MAQTGSGTETPQLESARNLSCRSKLRKDGLRNGESIASSLSDTTKNAPVFAASRFNSLKWTTAHKFFTEYCDVQLQLPLKNNIPELYDSLEDMIKDAFAGDRLIISKQRETVLTPNLSDLSTDHRIRSLNEKWMSDFQLLYTLDEVPTSERERVRQMHENDTTRQLVYKDIGFKNLKLTDKTLNELSTMLRLENFMDTYLYMMAKKVTSEDFYRKCLAEFLEALFLRTFPPPPKRHQYLRPAIGWSRSGKTVAEPDGTVVSRKCLKNKCFDAFAYIEVKRESKYRKMDSERCLQPREEKPEVPWQCVQEVLDGALPQHLLELLLSADDTVFKTVKKEATGFTKYFTKVGLIQQDMKINVVILKLCEEDFVWLVPGKEKGKRLQKEYEALISRKNCRNIPDILDVHRASPEATGVPSEEGLEVTESFSNEEGQEVRESSSEAPSSGSDKDIPSEDDLAFIEEDIHNDESTTEKEFIRSLKSRGQKKVRFKDCLDDDNGLQRTPPALYISKTYCLLNHQERVHLAQGLIMLEAIADNIISSLTQWHHSV